MFIDPYVCVTQNPADPRQEFMVALTGLADLKRSCLDTPESPTRDIWP